MECWAKKLGPSSRKCLTGSLGNEPPPVEGRLYDVLSQLRRWRGLLTSELVRSDPSLAFLKCQNSIFFLRIRLYRSGMFLIIVRKILRIIIRWHIVLQMQNFPISCSHLFIMIQLYNIQAFIMCHYWGVGDRIYGAGVEVRTSFGLCLLWWWLNCAPPPEIYISDQIQIKI